MHQTVPETRPRLSVSRWPPVSMTSENLSADSNRTGCSSLAAESVAEPREGVLPFGEMEPSRVERALSATDSPPPVSSTAGGEGECRGGCAQLDGGAM